MQNARVDYLAHYLEITRYKWIFVLSISLFFGFFLLVFQPFGVNNFDPSFRISLQFFLVILSFSVVIFTVLATSDFLLRPLVLKNPDRTQLVVWLAWDYLLVSSTAFGFYNYVGDWHDLSWASYLGFVRDVSMVITFPVAAFLFYIRHEFLKSEFVQLRALKPTIAPPGMVHFSSDNDKDKISVAREDFLYLESQDNYVTVVYMDNGTRKSALIRSSLKRLEAMLTDSILLLRCHRSFIVNLSRVRTCQGNRHGLKLNLEGEEKSIPVSRGYTERLLQALEKPGSPA